MKRISLIAVVACLTLAMFTAPALAATFEVKSSFGVRVTEQGISEQVGEISIKGAEIGDIFQDQQIITVELLGNATISRTFAAEYAYGDNVLGNPNRIYYTDDPEGDGIVVGDDTEIGVGTEYRVVAIEGQDFFTVETFAAGADFNDYIIIGHDEIAVDWNPADGDTDDEFEAAGQYSALCFNLEGTIYNSNDPAQQLVQVSYADSLSNTFSGDIYVATVKPSTVVLDTCAKTVPDIELDFTESQDLDCGHGTDSVCLFTFQDPAAGALDGEFIFRVGKTDGAFLGMGISSLSVQKSVDGGQTWDDVTMGGLTSTPVSITTRWDRSGAEIELADYEDNDYYTAAELLYVDSSQVEGTVTLTGTGTDVIYRMLATVRYDTCVATAGDWLIDVVASRVPCGGSFGATDWLAANVVEEGGILRTAIFPYGAGLGAGWYNGISIWNPMSTDLTVSFAITEADGDAYSATITVPAGEMSVGLVDTLLAPVTAGTDSAFGDENYNIVASANGTFYGFLFITNGTVAQGYLPIMPDVD